MARLENWYISERLMLTRGGLQVVSVAAGYVSGHDTLPDNDPNGEEITVTSPIKEIDKENTPPKWLQTMNTRYELGEPYKDPNLN